MRTAKKRIRCASCKKHIRAHEPDLVLEELAGGRPRHFHDRCSGAAYELALQNPAVYVLTVRHTDPSRNC